MASVFERGLTKPSGYVLPVQRWNSQAPADRAGVARSGRRGAASCSWCPATRPVGYRLPLGSLPYVPPSQLSATSCRVDPSLPRGALPRRPTASCRSRSRSSRRAAHPGGGLLHRRADSQQDRVEQELGEIGGAVRTARHGRAARRPALRLHAAGRGARGLSRAGRRGREAAAARPACRSRSRATRPPHDPRLNVIRVAPDPGVIEVNIHPAVELGRTASRPPRRSTRRRASRRLGADKFMIDGRHTGTGGGNHVVVGGATPNDSPFLRRPDLLKSLVLHWQRHPSLSYLFSGLFIGPTSQAPRIDEARHDSLYELEIAHGAGAAARAGRRRRCPGWSTGCSATCWSTSPATRTAPKSASTSCYSPDGPTGRLGLVEFRGFEMPPNARMSLAQQLLVRALIARFWTEPARRPLRALGHGAARPLHAAALSSGPISSTCSTTSTQHGFDFGPEWFEAQLEFRFPFCGEVEYDGREARTAPGARALARDGRAGRHRRHGALRRFLGRAAAGQARRRSIPSATPSTCNGRPVPLHADRRPRRRGRRRALQGVAAGLGPASGAAGQRAADLRHLRHAGRAARSAAASTTSPIRAAATTRPSRSTATRPRRAGSPASSRDGHTPAAFELQPPEKPAAEFPLTLDSAPPGRPR